ncbi:MAG: integrase [Cocleimonas sp.]
MNLQSKHLKRLIQYSAEHLPPNELKYFLKATEEHSGWKYYLPRMALLTGCRMNELCQLRKSDFRKDEEQYYISINTDTSDKQLKNKSSHREIPISKKLKILLLPLLNSKKTK